MAYVAPHNSLSRTCGLGCSFIDGIRRTPSRREAGVSRYPFLHQPCSGLVRPLRRLSAAPPLRGTAESPFPSGLGLSSRAWDRKEGVAPLLVIHPCTDLFACRRLCGVSPKSGKRKEACPWLSGRSTPAPWLLRGQSLNAHRPQPSFSDGHRHDAGRGTRAFGKVRPQPGGSMPAPRLRAIRRPGMAPPATVFSPC